MHHRIGRVQCGHAALVLVLMAAALLAAGCGVPGDPGRTYLAIDWAYAPQVLYFPAFPQLIIAGEYVEHAAGSYVGEYIAWDGTYWVADYWITVEPGGPAPLVGSGDHGDDYYLSLWLWSFGPEIYTDEIVARAIGSDGAREHVLASANPGDAPAEIIAARARMRAMEPTVVRQSAQTGRFVITVDARGYGPAGRESRR